MLEGCQEDFWTLRAGLNRGDHRAWVWKGARDTIRDMPTPDDWEDRTVKRKSRCRFRAIREKEGAATGHSLWGDAPEPVKCDVLRRAFAASGRGRGSKLTSQRWHLSIARFLRCALAEGLPSPIPAHCASWKEYATRAFEDLSASILWERRAAIVLLVALRL